VKLRYDYSLTAEISTKEIADENKKYLNINDWWKNEHTP